MAQVQESGRDRQTNMELNLVPVIDLMSVLITFLLITAVWSQVSMIQIGSSVYGKKTENQTPLPPPPLADIPLRLDVKDFGFRLIIGSEHYEFPKKNGFYDLDSLHNRLKTVKEKYPTKSDAVITVDDELPYENMIMGMDSLLNGGFPAISISTVGAE
jgi:biopolymer transport protein TolR